jgi:hypothetical protein
LAQDVTTANQQTKIMENHIVKVSVEPTHDVMRFKVQKPEGYTFVSGQATDVSINTPTLKRKDHSHLPV